MLSQTFSGKYLIKYQYCNKLKRMEVFALVPSDIINYINGEIMFGLGAPEVAVLVVGAVVYGIFIPLNVKMARKRNMNIVAAIILTLFFTWFVTLVLFFVRRIDCKN
jgi:hypothetical protein